MAAGGPAGGPRPQDVAAALTDAGPLVLVADTLATAYYSRTLWLHALHAWCTRPVPVGTAVVCLERPWAAYRRALPTGTPAPARGVWQRAVDAPGSAAAAAPLLEDRTRRLALTSDAATAAKALDGSPAPAAGAMLVDSLSVLIKRYGVGDTLRIVHQWSKAVGTRCQVGTLFAP